MGGNEMSSTYASQDRGGGQQPTISWNGSPWSLTGLSFLNALLGAITLGIYRFWGKSEVRRRLWSSVRLNDEPFEYTGTGGELFKGFLIALFLILLPAIAILVAIQLTMGPDSPFSIAAFTIFYVGFGFLIAVAYYRAMRYRLSRTRWRGIRGSLGGSSGSYGWSAFWTGIVTALTLGWLVPWRTVRLAGQVTNNAKLGGEPFRLSASSSSLYGPFAVLWVGGIAIYAVLGGMMWFLLRDKLPQMMPVEGEPPVPMQLSPYEIGVIFASVIAAGIVMSLFAAWYYARSYNAVISGTSIDRANFRMETTAGGFIGLIITNTLLILFTLGILTPVAQARTLRYLVEKTSIDGSLDVERIVQSSAKMDPYGEGMAEMFDIDIF